MNTTEVHSMVKEAMQNSTCVLWVVQAELNPPQRNACSKESGLLMPFLTFSFPSKHKSSSGSNMEKEEKEGFSLSTVRLVANQAYSFRGICKVRKEKLLGCERARMESSLIKLTEGIFTLPVSEIYNSVE